MGQIAWYDWPTTSVIPRPNWSVLLLQRNMVKKDGADLLSTAISWAVNIARATSPGLGLYVNLPALRKAKKSRQQAAKAFSHQAGRKSLSNYVDNIM